LRDLIVFDAIKEVNKRSPENANLGGFLFGVTETVFILGTLLIDLKRVIVY